MEPCSELVKEFSLKTGISYFGVRNPDFVRIDMQIIASLGYTHVLHTFSEADLFYYPDTMAKIIKISSQLGLKVYVNPWGVGRVFGGEAFSEIAARNPEAAQCNQDDQPIVAACPNSPIFVEYMYKWIDTVCAMEIETVFWDEPHFYFVKDNPNLCACRCKCCRKKFRRLYNHSMPVSLSERVQEFRQKSLIEFLDLMTKRVRSLGKRNSLCMLPPSFNDGINNWSEFAALEALDEIGTDPYWQVGETETAISKSYHQASCQIMKLAKEFDKEPQMWIKNYHIQSNNEETVAAATWAAYNEGVRNIFAWSFKGSAYMSWLASDDPEKVWEIQCTAFSECQDKAQEEQKCIMAEKRQEAFKEAGIDPCNIT